MVCLIGASGPGKSTLLLCINVLETISSGQITVDGIDVHAPQTHLAHLRRKLGIIFQQFNAFPHLTALRNVSLAPRKVLKLRTKEAEELAEKHLVRVGLGDKLDQYTAQLSRGQQQRLAIARALAMSPDYLLLDEVTPALDPELVGEVLDTLRMLAKDGMTMIAVTHEMLFAREVADRVAFFHEGVIHEIDAARDLINNPQKKRTQEFFGNMFVILQGGNFKFKTTRIQQIQSVNSVRLYCQSSFSDCLIPSMVRSLHDSRTDSAENCA